MAKRRTTQFTTVANDPYGSYDQVADVNARLSQLPAIESAKRERRFQEEQKKKDAAALAKTKQLEAEQKETERLDDIAAEEAKEEQKKTERTQLGLEATKLGLSLSETGGTLGDIPGSIIDKFPTTFGGGSPTTITPSTPGLTAPRLSPQDFASGTPYGGPGFNQPGGRGDVPFVTPSLTTSSGSGGGGGGFFSDTLNNLSNFSLGSAAGAGLAGFGASQMFSDKSEATKAGWGAAAGGLMGLLGGGTGSMFTDILGGGLFGGLGGLLG